MSKNQKVKEIEKLFEGGDVDLYKILHFLIEEFKNYKVLEFRTNTNEILKFYEKDNSKFMDLVDNKGYKVISNYKIKCFFEIVQLEEIKEVGLINQRWFINHIIE